MEQVRTSGLRHFIEESLRTASGLAAMIATLILSFSSASAVYVFHPYVDRSLEKI